MHMSAPLEPRDASTRAAILEITLPASRAEVTQVLMEQLPVVYWFLVMQVYRENYTVDEPHELQGLYVSEDRLITTFYRPNVPGQDKFRTITTLLPAV
jgi:hypothetical protein